MDRAEARRELRRQLQALPTTTLLERLKAKGITLRRQPVCFPDPKRDGWFTFPNGSQRVVRVVDDEDALRRAIVRLVMSPPKRALVRTLHPGLVLNKIGAVLNLEGSA